MWLQSEMEEKKLEGDSEAIRGCGPTFQRPKLCLKIALK